MPMNTAQDVEETVLRCARAVGQCDEGDTVDDFDVIGVVADMVESYVRECDRLRAENERLRRGFCDEAYRVAATVKGPEQREPVEVVRADQLAGAISALELAQTALHKLCLARGSTDGYGHIFAAINAALPDTGGQ